jgi:hypothetical protein
VILGTVQGILAASRHVLWYVNYETGGDATRSITE